MNRWQNTFFKGLNANAKLLYILIQDNCNKQCVFEIDKPAIKQALKPLTDAEIRTAFKEINSVVELSQDKKKLRLIACNEAGMLPFGEPELKKSRKKFTPPTLAEVSLVIKDKKLAQKFINHYESNGWVVGRVKMISWTAAANNWQLDNEDKPQQTEKKSITF